jgi:hypothetical protein
MVMVRLSYGASVVGLDPLWDLPWDLSRLMRPAQYLICASALAVGPENNHQVCIGQANFENDCTVITM